MLDFKKLLSTAKEVVVVALRKLFFITGVTFLGLFLFATIIALVLFPFVGNGTPVFEKLLCSVSHGASCVPLQLFDWIYVIFVVAIGGISIFGVISSVTSNIVAVSTGLEPTSKGFALIVNFLTGIFILVLILFASLLASVLMLLFAFVSLSIYANFKSKSEKKITTSTYILSFGLVLLSGFTFIAWTSIGLPVLLAIIPSIILLILVLILLKHKIFYILSKQASAS